MFFSIAARREKYADAVITYALGCNAAVLTLGMGIAWFVGALYWRGRGNGTFDLLSAWGTPDGS